MWPALFRPTNRSCRDWSLHSPTVGAHSTTYPVIQREGERDGGAIPRAEAMAGDGDLKLLGLMVSPFVTRVRLALHMKGVGYEYIETDVLDKGELLLRYNPVHKKVPVLIHNGVPLCESQVIVQYVDEVWSAGAPILPADPYARATARFWAAYVDDKLFPAWLGILLAPTEAATAVVPDPDAAVAFARKLQAKYGAAPPAN
uniref:Glutathione S-transferase n=1 Tax=Hordeum vulgare subsp. vulgare TaxID=112509 RepID=A0A8I7BFG4_HORVV